jgi:hypothetical protein
MSAGERYGLEEIPFEPTGQPVPDKYPYVRPDSYDGILDRLRECVVENKLYVLLLKSPHGGGKTSILHELRESVGSGEVCDPPVSIRSQELLNIDIREYAEQAITDIEGGEHGLDVQATDAATLKSRIADGLARAGEDSNLVLWVIDEFDILIDRPEEEQQEFLQFLRDIVERLVDEDVPIAFVMSHTRPSGVQFEEHLSGMHEPFHSRIVASVELGYTIDEIKAIVEQRLAIVRTTETQSRLHPFTEDAVEELYTLTTTLGEGGGLSNFRVFERVCYFSLLEGAEQGLDVIDADFVRDRFEEYSPDTSDDPGTSYTPATRTRINDVLVSSPIEQNEVIAQGITTALDLRNDYEILSSDTDYLGQAGGTDVSLLKLEIKFRSDRTFTISWIIAQPDGGILPDSDVDALNEHIEEQEDDLFANLRLLTYVSDLDTDSEFSNTDMVHRIDNELVNDLIGLTAEQEEDFPDLRAEFDREIQLDLEEKLAQEVRDITDSFTSAQIRLAKSIHVIGYSQEELTRQSIRDEDKVLWNRAQRASESKINTVVESGFAIGDPNLQPALPRSLDKLVSQSRSDALSRDEAEELFGANTEWVIDIAEELGLVTANGSVRAVELSDIEESVDENIERFETLLEEDAVSGSPAGSRAQMLIDSYRSVSTSDTAHALIIYQAIGELYDEIASALEEIDPSPILGQYEDSSTESEEDGEDGEEKDDGQEQIGDAGEDDSDETEVTSQTQSSGVDSVDVEEREEPETTEEEESDDDEEVPLEDAITNLLAEDGPMTKNELSQQLEGYDQDIGGVLMGMIVRNEIKVTR